MRIVQLSLNVIGVESEGHLRTSQLPRVVYLVLVRTYSSLVANTRGILDKIWGESFCICISQTWLTEMKYW